MSEYPTTTPETTPATPTRRVTAAVRWLLAINIAVYFVQLTLVRQADVLAALGLQRDQAGRQWWTIGTHLFVHTGFWHLAVNMAVLWYFGPRVEWRSGTREFVRFYLVCGLGGGFAYLALVGGDPAFVGATSPVLGVVLAYARLWRDEAVDVPGVATMNVRGLAWIAGVVTMAGGMLASGEGSVAALAHAGGLVAGLLYLRTTAAVNLGALRQSVSPVPDEPEDVPPRAVPRALPRSRGRERENIDDVVARSNAAVAKRSAPPRAGPEPDAELAALDKILDKIFAHGIESLSDEERALLDDASRRLRDS